MRLYHFTAERYVGAILRQGLCLGCLVVSTYPVVLEPGWRWLTTNPGWDQSWAEGSGRLPYKTNEARLAVDIPGHAAGRLRVWNVSGPILSRAYDTLSAFGDPENWRLYQGDIPAAWITAVDYNPNLIGKAG